jgi:catechol 2,3-dioxygenase-like lactoylglutathione lyase family enzyme
MPLLHTTGLVHFSIPANDVDESLRFYTEILGMQFRGNVGANGRCVTCGDVNLILVGREAPRPVDEPLELNGALCHQAFYVASEEFDRAVDGLKEQGVPFDTERDVEYRKTGTFTGRSFYFYDPTGNRLELNDPNPPTWPAES